MSQYEFQSKNKIRNRRWKITPKNISVQPLQEARKVAYIDTKTYSTAQAKVCPVERWYRPRSRPVKSTHARRPIVCVSQLATMLLCFKLYIYIFRCRWWCWRRENQTRFWKIFLAFGSSCSVETLPGFRLCYRMRLDARLRLLLSICKEWLFFRRVRHFEFVRRI